MGAKRGNSKGGLGVAIIDNSAVAGVDDLSYVEAQYGRDSGFRVGVGYQFANCWDVTWNYTYFYTDGATAFLATPANSVVDLPNFNVWGIGGELGTSGAYAFRSTLVSHVNDLEFGRWIRIDDSASLRLFGGFRWAIIDQTLLQAYTGALDGGGLDNTAASLRTANMDGYGFRLGTEGRMNLPSGFSLFGKTSASVLAGHFDYSRSEIHVAGAAIGPPVITVQLANDSTTEVVPVLEGAVGAAWTYNQIELSLGYEVNAWFNSAYGEDLLLDGLFVRAAFTR